MDSRDWASAQRVLCVRLDTIGDVLMTTPALRALKQQLPGRSITLLTSTIGSQVACLVPEVDEVGIYDPPWMKATEVRIGGDSDRAMIDRLRRQNFDAAVIFTVYSQSAQPAALLVALADIPLRLAHCRENPYGLLTDWVREPEPESFIRHEVRRHLDLVGTIGAASADQRLSLQPTPGAFMRVQDMLRPLGFEMPRPWAVIHPGASAPSRRYPAERFGEVARELHEQSEVQLLFTGTDEETSLVETAMHIAGGGISLAGRLSLDELAALIAMADVVVTNNTAPAHIASAVGTPVVDVYALTNPQHTPWQVPSRVLFHDTDCKYCYQSLCPLGHHRCLELVEPSAVAQAALELLAMSPRRAEPDLAEVALAGVDAVAEPAVC